MYVSGEKSCYCAFFHLKLVCCLVCAAGMCEIPYNVIVADQFLDVFDGYSIGSNDLTQLCLGVDRDSDILSRFLFCSCQQIVYSIVIRVIASMVFFFFLHQPV